MPYYIFKPKAFTVTSRIKETRKVRKKEVKSLSREKKGQSIWFCVAIFKVIFLYNPCFYNGSLVVKKVPEKHLKFNLKSKCYCLDKWLIRLRATLFKTGFYLTEIAEILMS